jgi:predicted AlkP superfamily pyrophosphatase or phosphodiesterase
MLLAGLPEMSVLRRGPAGPRNGPSLTLLAAAIAISILPTWHVAPAAAPARTAPGLIVLLVADQMRADYVDRYQHQWIGGLRRLLDRGARFTEAAYPYLNTVTCAGHATIGTGRFPSRHGMILNEWWERESGRRRTCTDDPTVTSIAANARALKNGHSAALLLGPTLAEAIAGRGGRVVSISLKPRSAIMLAGRRGDLVTWFDESGTWATSSAYAPAFPASALQYVTKHPIESWRGAPWTKLLAPIRYKGSDEGEFEKPGVGWTKVFPHALDGTVDGPGARFYAQWERSPFADSYSADLAIDAVDALALGRDERTDFLAVSFSVLDRAGHSFGPDSHEVQDVLARLDRTIGRLLSHLDVRVGRGRYALALTADHGVAPIPEQMKASGGNAGRIITSELGARVNEALKPILGSGQHVATMLYTDLYFAEGVWTKIAASPYALKAATDALMAHPGIAHVLRGDSLPSARTDPNPVRRAAALSYNQGRSGDLIVIPKANWITSADATTHGTLHPYNQRVPIILYGSGVKPGVQSSPASPADIAPTLARIAAVTLEGTDGRPLIEAIGREETTARRQHVP